MRPIRAAVRALGGRLELYHYREWLIIPLAQGLEHKVPDRPSGGFNEPAGFHRLHRTGSD